MSPAEQYVKDMSKSNNIRWYELVDLIEKAGLGKELTELLMIDHMPEESYSKRIKSYEPA